MATVCVWGSSPQKIFTFLKLQDQAPFLKQIRKRIGSKLTVFYKNGYHFRKISNVKILTWILLDFYPSFAVKGVQSPVAKSLQSHIGKPGYIIRLQNLGPQ